MILPNLKVNLDEWSDAVRKIQDIDKRTPKEIAQLWSLITQDDRDGFNWSTNCRTPKKLRQSKDGLKYFEIIHRQLCQQQPSGAFNHNESDRSWASGSIDDAMKSAENADGNHGNVIEGEVL